MHIFKNSFFYSDHLLTFLPTKVKDTLWEGGVRGAAFLWSPKLTKASRVANQMMNVEDWLPTLFSIAGNKTFKHFEFPHFFSAVLSAPKSAGNSKLFIKF